MQSQKHLSFVHPFCVEAPRALHSSCTAWGLPVTASECQVLPHAQTSGLWPERSHLTLADGLGCVRRHAHVALANWVLHPASSSFRITARGGLARGMLRLSALHPPQGRSPWKPRLQELLFRGEPTGGLEGAHALAGPLALPGGHCGTDPLPLLQGFRDVA